MKQRDNEWRQARLVAQVDDGPLRLVYLGDDDDADH